MFCGYSLELLYCGDGLSLIRRSFECVFHGAHIHRGLNNLGWVWFGKCEALKSSSVITILFVPLGLPLTALVKSTSVRNTKGYEDDKCIPTILYRLAFSVVCSVGMDHL